ncbi:MAG: phosphate ABC transporter, permease protein PstA, partial [Oceanospirillaceae bacterium]|nr:phosphate ABC transporter, permease protein PstA [Oceanospirillaceae bacterium]
MRVSLKEWTKSGEPWVWLNAGAVAICLIMVVGLLSLIAVRGLGHFWPANIHQADYTENGNTLRMAGELVEIENVPAAQLRESGVNVPEGLEFMQRDLMKIGNRDVGGSDFIWVLDDFMLNRSTPEMMFAAERREWGNFYGYLRSLKENGQVVASHDGYEKNAEYMNVWNKFQASIDRALDLHHQIEEIEKDDIGAINYELERLRLKERSLQLKEVTDQSRYAEIDQRRKELDVEYQSLQQVLLDLYT